MSNFGIKIDLLKLKNSFVTNLKGKAETKRCLVIPIDDAQLFLGEKGIYLNLTGVEMQEVRFDDTHFVKQQLPKDVYQAMTEEERYQQPILGSMRPIASVQKQMEVKTTTDSTQVEDDDLPF